MASYLTKKEVVEISKNRVKKNKSYSDWVQYFMENGAPYNLAKSMAKSQCFDLYLEDEK